MAVDYSNREKQVETSSSNVEHHQTRLSKLIEHNAQPQDSELREASDNGADSISEDGRATQQESSQSFSRAIHPIVSDHATPRTRSAPANSNDESHRSTRKPSIGSNPELSIEASLLLNGDDKPRSVAKDAIGSQQTRQRVWDANSQQSGRSFFVVGRVFSTSWHEPVLPYSRARRSGGAQVGRNRTSRSLGGAGSSDNQSRTFVVVAHIQDFCLAVPVTPYGGKGLTERRFSEAERKGHALIYYEGTVPFSSRGEPSLAKEAIAVKRDFSGVRLGTTSMINFRKPTTIRWNSQADNIGLVSPKSIENLTKYFVDEVCRDGNKWRSANF